LKSPSARSSESTLWAPKSTGQNEEVLIVLEGKGEMLFSDGHSLPVQARHAVYCPPNMEHDVKNTGQVALRYV
jgi:mannose-6-phosphate isomerase-like protein (cupin superfamily)